MLCCADPRRRRICSLLRVSLLRAGRLLVRRLRRSARLACRRLLLPVCVSHRRQQRDRENGGVSAAIHQRWFSPSTASSWLVSGAIIANTLSSPNMPAGSVRGIAIPEHEQRRLLRRRTYPRICTVTPDPPEIAITFARTKFARTPRGHQIISRGQRRTHVCRPRRHRVLCIHVVDRGLQLDVHGQWERWQS